MLGQFHLKTWRGWHFQNGRGIKMFEKVDGGKMKMVGEGEKWYRVKIW